MTIRLLAVLLLLLMVVGLAPACTSAADPSEPSQPTTSSKFPDMSGYTPVNPEDYKRETENPGRPDKLVGYYFNTPDGIRCLFDQYPAAACSGNNLPGIPPTMQCDQENGWGAVNEMSTLSGIRQVRSICQDGSPLNEVLPPFHTLTVYGVICGVDDKKTTACKDPQGRGFVLSPSWSGWLEHV